MSGQNQAYFNFIPYNTPYFWQSYYYPHQFYTFSGTNMAQQEISYEEKTKTLPDNSIKIENKQAAVTQNKRGRKNLEYKERMEKNQRLTLDREAYYQQNVRIKQKQLDQQQNQCSIEELACDQNNENQICKTNWSTEEQQKLKQLVNLFGKRWKYISQYFPNRTGKQIRQRYLNYLRPNLSLKKWTLEEDGQLLILIEKYGRSWRMIQKKMKHRSQNQIKNRYYGHLQKIQKNTNKQNGNQIYQNKEEKQVVELKTQTHLEKQKQSSESVKL